MPSTLDDIMRLRTFLKRYPNLCSETTLRWMIQQRDFNGLAESGAVHKVNGCWFINVPKIQAYLMGESA